MNPPVLENGIREFRIGTTDPARGRPAGFAPAPLIAAFVLAGCSGQSPPLLGADTAMYELRDTVEYENMLYGGEYALLVRDGEVVDTIDLSFGLQRLNSGAVAFLPVRTFPIEEIPGARDITDHVVSDGSRRVHLNSFLPHFHDGFSSPSVIEGVLYYWGLQGVGEGEYRVHAARYDAANRGVETAFLGRMEIRTDNRQHFAPPAQDGASILFESYEGAFRVDRERWVPLDRR